MVPQIVFDVDPVKQQINRRVVAVNEIEQEHPFDEYQNRSCKFLEILQVYEYFFSFVQHVFINLNSIAGKIRRSLVKRPSNNLLMLPNLENFETRARADSLNGIKIKLCFLPYVFYLVASTKARKLVDILISEDSKNEEIEQNYDLFDWCEEFENIVSKDYIEIYDFNECKYLSIKHSFLDHEKYSLSNEISP